MIFQFNPVDYLIETTEEGELVVTIARPDGAAPKIRYNLKDSGGTMTYRALKKACSDYRVEIDKFSERQGAFPIVFVFGRNDLSAPFYGAKVFPHDIETIVTSDPQLSGKINSFQIESIEDEQLGRTLRIHLEKVKDFRGDLPDSSRLHEIIFDGLCRVNQDFREVTKMFKRSNVMVVLHEFESDNFSERDIRIKNKYVT